MSGTVAGQVHNNVAAGFDAGRFRPASAGAQHALGDPPPILRILEDIAAATIGHRLFTIMRFDPLHDEVERIHSSNPAAYPVGGRKRKKDTAWSAHVLGAMRALRADDPAAIRAAFDDHTTILGLGLGSCLNIPVPVRGPLHRHRRTPPSTKPDGIGPQDEETGRALTAFLIPALLAGRAI